LFEFVENNILMQLWTFKSNKTEKKIKYFNQAPRQIGSLVWSRLNNIAKKKRRRKEKKKNYSSLVVGELDN